MYELNLSIKTINKLINDKDINVLEYRKLGTFHYVYTRFKQEDDFKFETMIPIVYPKAALCLNTNQAVAVYLKSIKKFFTREAINQWFTNELLSVPDSDGIKYTFLRILLGSKGKRLLSSDFPQNPNAQKIIEGWRNEGYYISTIHGNKATNNETPHWMVPLPNVKKTFYERMPKPFVKKVIKTLGGINVFECRDTTGDLPDHKFSEIRWDENVATENTINITEDEIRKKFQILDTQRNQQKREVCRHCYETGERGTIYGIKFFYAGTDKWDPSIPQRGKDAERGCVGCPWYDIQKWREELQKYIDINR